jgi:ribosomal protein S18 acetylase RimI-like enzyme
VLPRLYAPHGRVWVSEQPIGGAAWLKPGAWPIPAATRRAVLPAQLRTFGRHPLRAIAGQAEIDRGHPHAPHWYLDFIGVAPGSHGRGAGSALLAAMLEETDRERIPTALNAGSPRSRELYRRHGFEVTEEFRLPWDGPPLWRMWREPRR